MAENEWLAQQFEAQRARLRGVAYRMLGSQSEAEDAVQEAWLRLSQSDASGVANLPGWLTTVVARLCLDALRSRKSRREESSEARAAQPIADREDAIDPESDALLGDSIGLALLVVLDTLAPAERVAFVLHDMFDLSFDEIAPIVSRSPTAARQLASRARRRVQGASAAPDRDDVERKRAVVDAFLAASRAGDFAALLAVLNPDVVLRADDAALEAAANYKGQGAPGLAKEVRGASTVAEMFKGRARGALPALIDGSPGAIWARGAETRGVFAFTVEDGKIVAIEVFMDPSRIAQLDVER